MDMVKTYAVITNGKVVNIALSDKPLAGNWIESSAARIGDMYENGAFEKIEQVAPQAEVKKDKIDVLIEALVAKGILSENDLKGSK